MSRLIKFNDLTDDLNAKGRAVFKLNGASNLTAHLYEIKVTATHTNAEVLSTDIFKFWGNIIDEITLQLGTGSEIIELPIREHIYRQIVRRERIFSDVKTAVGSDLVSSLNLIIDLSSIGYLRPQDTAVYTHLYNDKNIFVTANDFKSVAGCTVTNVQLKVKETFLENMTSTVDSEGNIIPMVKRPLLKTIACNGLNSKFEIDLPESTQVSEALIYVTDGNGDIVEGTISDISLKNAHTNIFKENFQDLNNQNQLDIFKGVNSLYKGVAMINIANGKYSRVINTSNQVEKSTKIVLNINPNGASDLVVNALFETVQKG